MEYALEMNSTEGEKESREFPKIAMLGGKEPKKAKEINELL
jgi:hypothetical protein